MSFGGPMDRVLLLRTMPLFEGLGPIQLAAIAQHAGERVLVRESTLSLRARSNDAYLVVVEGELEAGTKASAERYSKGDAVGLVELLTHSDEVLTLKAAVDTILLELDWEAQLDVWEEHFAVIMSHVAFLSSRLVERSHKLTQPELGPVPLIAAQKFGKPLDFNERLLLLSRSHAFSPGCIDALSELTHHVEEVRMRKGQRVWSAGQESDHFLLIASGALRLEDEHGGEAIYRPGTAAGMAESLSRQYRRFSAVTLQTTVALRVQIEVFMDILEDHFDLSLDVLATLAHRFTSLGSAETRPDS